MKEEDYLERSKTWLLDFVIDKKLCPFARQVFVQNRIAYRCLLSASMQEQLEEAYSLFLAMQEGGDWEHISNALLLLPLGLDDFEDYLDFYDCAQALLEESGLDLEFQLAHFHPDFCFDGEEPEAAGNYVNRSPFPMLHILRVEEVEQAIDSHPDIDAVPLHNQELLEALGVDVLAQQLHSYQEK